MPKPTRAPTRAGIEVEVWAGTTVGPTKKKKNTNWPPWETDYNSLPTCGRSAETVAKAEAETQAVA